MWLAAWGDHGNSRRYVESFKVSALTVLDVPHVQMDARHQNTNSLGALVAQQLHHLRVEKRGVITVLLHSLIPTVHLGSDSKSKVIILLSSLLGNPQKSEE